MTIKTNLSRRSFLSASSLAAGFGFMTATNSVLGKPMRLLDASSMYGPPPYVAKLNANENPYGPSPKAIKAMTDAISKGAYYVDKSADVLREMIAEKYGLTKDYVLLSSGSSSALTSLAMMVSQQGSILGSDLFWDATSKMGTRNSKYGIKRTVKTKDLSVDLDEMYSNIDDETNLVQICNPNNPTGTIIPPEMLKKFCKKASLKTMVLIDEAYNEVTDNPNENTMIPLIKSGYNVVVSRTFSKIYGLAGMRIGYMIASPKIIKLVSEYGHNHFYSLNQAGIAAAIASYDDTDFLVYSKSKILEAREMIDLALKENGLSALPSQSSFMFVDLGNINAEDFRQEMANENILIRGIYQDYINWSRVSVGKINDVKKYIDALPKVIASLS